MIPQWSTACLDWEERIAAGRSLLPIGPLFPGEAEAGLEVFRNLQIADAAGRPTFGEASRPWFFDLPTALFGAYDPDSGRRLIREYMLLVSKKNGKSTLAPGIMLTALIRNWREQGEFYIIAPTKELADNSFGPAEAMVRADEDLSALIHTQSFSRVLTHRKTEATLRVIAADSQTATGKKTIGYLVEELHEFGARSDAGSMLREIKGGLAARPEGFGIYISTQSSKPPRGIFAETLAEFRDIRDGKVDVPHKLPLLYEFPKAMVEAKAYENAAFWYVTNPNLGLSVDETYLRDEQASAKRKGKAELADFYAKHLNVEVGQALRSDGWAGAAIWANGIYPALSLDDILRRAEVITVGIDGGGLDDLMGIGVIGREKGSKRWLAWSHGLISTIGLDRRKANWTDYLKFKADGDLDVFRFGGSVDPAEDAAPELEFARREDGTFALEAELPPEFLEGLLPAPEGADGALVAPDIAYVVSLVTRIRDAGLLAQVGVDAAGIGGIVDALAGIGVTQDEDQLGAVRQGIALMGAIKTVERKLADRTFRHGGSRMLGWCVGNARTVATPTAMRIARDESGYGKIDPLMALFNAAALMAMNPEPADDRSIYTAERGLLFVG